MDNNNDNYTVEQEIEYNLPLETYEKVDECEEEKPINEATSNEPKKRKLSKKSTIFIALSSVVVAIVIAIVVTNIFIPFATSVQGFDVRLQEGKYVLVSYKGNETDVVIPIT